MFRYPALFILVVFALSACATGLKANPEGIRNVKTVSVITDARILSKSSFSENYYSIPGNLDAAEAVQKELGSFLEERGFRVTSAGVTVMAPYDTGGKALSVAYSGAEKTALSTLGRENEAFALFPESKEPVKQALPIHKSSGISDGQVASLTDVYRSFLLEKTPSARSVSSLAEGSDSVLLVSAVGEYSSAASAAGAALKNTVTVLGALAGSRGKWESSNKTLLNVYMLDSRTGRLLWKFEDENGSDPTTEEFTEMVRDAVEDARKAFPE